MRHRLSVVALLVAASSWGCSDADMGAPGTDPANKKDSELKRVDREALPDSRFKPMALEATIEKVVANIEGTEQGDDIALGVILKEINNFWRPVVVGANRALGELEIAGAVQGNTASGNQGG